MRFEQALQAMREGKKVYVKNGNPSNEQWHLWIRKNHQGKEVLFVGLNEDIWQCPYVLSIVSILSEDWEIVDE